MWITSYRDVGAATRILLTTTKEAKQQASLYQLVAVDRRAERVDLDSNATMSHRQMNRSSDDITWYNIIYNNCYY